MKFLSAPWRWDFISKFTPSKGCVFCSALKSDADDNPILFRGKKYFVILNKYPYATGHLMIVPYRHVATPNLIPAAETVEMWQLVNQSLRILKNSYHPQGFNIGMNIGAVAGAGIHEHCHLHIVPRWRGDANFMAVTGNTKVISYDINKILTHLKKEFNK